MLEPQIQSPIFTFRQTLPPGGRGGATFVEAYGGHIYWLVKDADMRSISHGVV
jgi:hypothetical protein